MPHTRLYFQNAAAGATPAGYAGDWDGTTSATTSKMATTRSGAGPVFTTLGRLDGGTGAYDRLVARFVSDTLPAQTLAGSLDGVIALAEDTVDLNAALHLHAYVMKADGTVRGTLLADYVEDYTTREFSTSGVTCGRAFAAAQTLTPVTVTSGDRVVVEVGFRANNTTVSFAAGYVGYGGTSATELAHGGDGFTYTSWIEFSADLFDPPAPLQTKIGVLTKSVAAATATQSETGFGFAPDLTFFFMAGPTADDTWTPDFQACLGFGAGAAVEVSIGGASDDAAATSDAARRITAIKAITILSPASSLLATADYTADADGFTLSWTTNDAVANRIGYLAIGGLDNVATGSLSLTTTGNVATTAPGFQPDIVFVLNPGAVTTLDSTSGSESHSFGAMTTTDQWCVLGFTSDAQATSNTYRMHATDQILLGSSGGGAVANASASRVSLDATGFTINVGALGSSRQIVWVAIKGGGHDLGTFDKATGAAPASQSITGIGFEPAGVLLASDQNVTTALSADHNRFGLGVSDGTTEYAVAFSDTDNLADTSVDSRQTLGKAFLKVNNDTQTVDAAADLTPTSDGFDLAWTTNDAVATKLFYWAFGPAAAPEIDYGTVIQTKVGVFTKALGTGAQNLVDVGFRPDLTLFFMAGPEADDTWTPDLRLCIGVGVMLNSTYENRTAIAQASGDNLAVSNAAKRLNEIGIGGSDYSLTVINNDGTALVLAHYDTTVNGFVLTYATNDAETYRIGYLAIAGIDAQVGSISPTTTGDYTTGTAPTTVVGFAPDVVLLLNHGATQTVLSSLAGASLSFGMFTPDDQWVVHTQSDDGVPTSSTHRMHATDAVALRTTGTGVAATTKGSFVAMTANGFTVNFSALSAASRFQWIAIKGGNHKIGWFDKATGAAPVSQAITAPGFLPSGVMLVSDQAVAGTAAVSHNRMGIGISDGTDAFALAYSDTDDLADTSVDSRQSANAFLKVDNDTQTVNALGTLDFTADGFDVDWAVNDAVATRIFYWAFGNALEDAAMRLYLNNATAPYTPATFKGAWIPRLAR